MIGPIAQCTVPTSSATASWTNCMKKDDTSVSILSSAHDSSTYQWLQPSSAQLIRPEESSSLCPVLWNCSILRYPASDAVYRPASTLRQLTTCMLYLPVACAVCSVGQPGRCGTKTSNRYLPTCPISWPRYRFNFGVVNENPGCAVTVSSRAHVRLLSLNAWLQADEAGASGKWRAHCKL
jgi:hypothetical protein